MQARPSSAAKTASRGPALSAATKRPKTVAATVRAARSKGEAPLSSQYANTIARGIAELDALEDLENGEKDAANYIDRSTPSALLQEDGSYRWECPLCPYVAMASVTRRIHVLKDNHKKKHPGMKDALNAWKKKGTYKELVRELAEEEKKDAEYACPVCAKGFTSQQAVNYTRGTRAKAKVAHWKKEHPDLRPRGYFGIAYRRTINEHNGWRIARARVHLMNKRLPNILREQHVPNGHNFRWVYIVKPQKGQRFREGLFRLGRKTVCFACGRMADPKTRAVPQCAASIAHSSPRHLRNAIDTLQNTAEGFGPDTYYQGWTGKQRSCATPPSGSYGRVSRSWGRRPRRGTSRRHDDADGRGACRAREPQSGGEWWAQGPHLRHDQCEWWHYQA